MNNKISLCIDIGGTHIVAAAINEETMTLCNENANIYGEVNSMGDEKSILKEWAAVVDQALAFCSTPLDSVYISIPGPFDYKNGICLMDGMHKYQSLLNKNLRNWFADHLNINEDFIYFYNDAEAFLMGELYHHDLYDRKVIGLTLGTGLGSAYYGDNCIRDLNYGSVAFRDGIAEDYISTRGLINYVNQMYGKKYPNVKAMVEDSSIGSLHQEIFDYLAHTLAQFIQENLYDLQPSVILLGGGIARTHPLFLDTLQQVINIPIKIASMNPFNIHCGMIKYSN